MIKIDFHVHSNISDDSNMSFETVIKTAESKGLDGVILLDHNSISGDAELKSLIETYYDGVEESKRLIVIRAGEYSTEEGHIVILGLTTPLESLLVMKNGKYEARRIVELAKKQGAIVILAHPFRWKQKKISTWLASHLDAVEIYNSRNCFGRNNFGANALAVKWAKDLDLPIVGGSDAHFKSEIGNSFVCFNTSKSDFDFKKLNSYNSVVYGNYSNPIFEVTSQFIKAIHLKKLKNIPRLFPKLLYGIGIYTIAPLNHRMFLKGKIDEYSGK